MTREQELRDDLDLARSEVNRLTADRDNSNRLLDECRLERNVLQKICAERSDEIARLRTENHELRASLPRADS